jgi:serine/threonine protein kinase
LSLDKIKEYIGGGGFGQIYSAEHLLSKKIMVMKIIRLEPGSKNDMKMIEREFTTGHSLSALTPFLVKLSEFHIDEKYCYLVMEFCSGGDLQKIFNEKNKLPKNVYYIYVIFCLSIV